MTEAPYYIIEDGVFSDSISCEGCTLVSVLLTFLKKRNTKNPEGARLQVQTPEGSQLTIVITRFVASLAQGVSLEYEVI